MTTTKVLMLGMVKEEKTKINLSPDGAALNSTRRRKKWKQQKDECLKRSRALMEQRLWVDKAAEFSRSPGSPSYF